MNYICDMPHGGQLVAVAFLDMKCVAPPTFLPDEGRLTEVRTEVSDERRRWQSEIDAGRAVCAICGRPMSETPTGH